MCSAAAQVALQVRHDRITRGAWRRAQKRFGTQEHSRGAEAALKCAMIDKRLLQGVQFAVAGKSLDREHLFSRDVLERRDAGAHRFAIDDYGTGAARALAASVLGAGERKIGAQNP